jgi:hypothetical protein
MGADGSMHYKKAMATGLAFYNAKNPENQI